MLDTVALWKSDFGNQYTERNKNLNLGQRAAVWSLLIPKECQSVLEVGSNVGANLEAIAQISACELYACEPNDRAREILESTGLCAPHHVTGDTADQIKFPDKVADLVFTSGVLIHVPPDKLLPSMREIHRCARKWIVCGEYFAPSEEMVKYRGHDGAMWRRDYGGLYLDNFPDLRCVKTFFAWSRQTGLDNLLFWLLEKR